MTSQRGHARIGLFYGAVVSATVWGAAIAVLFPGDYRLVVGGAVVGVMGAALLIALGAEVAEFFISQGLAVAAITLFQVAPEMGVEAAIAYQKQVPLMLANFTGANRLLMGAGWPLIYAVAAFAHRRRRDGPLREIRLRRENILEIVFLAAPSAYFLLIVLKGELDLLDSVVLAGMFVAYLILLNRLPPEEEESKEDVIPMARRILELPPRQAGAITLGLITIGGIVIIVVAEPFVNSLQIVASALAISAFFFIQWMAPFLSEFPESLIAFHWARRERLAPLALLNVIASKINQWTLLILFIPVFYALGLGHIASIPLNDPSHVREIVLTIAMTTYGVAVLLKLRLTATDAAILFALWLLQFLFPANFPGTGLDVRDLTAAAFLILAVVEIVWYRREIHPREDLRVTRELMGWRKRTGGDGG